ncbi:hypothetical protein TREPR_1713 [Treponema primitia ZAS-2]|uniref:Uncharacterized protein n=1 Tax=Treponema primitia (strain ATCC BAA-887 / DSM 12427 / ZAS-2) TaxID=545694 RepID=F5YMV5_TREPZ|nr:hypothetical protein TREPR_1713 [Treponema primitia ZAS-2]
MTLLYYHGNIISYYGNIRSFINEEIMDGFDWGHTVMFHGFCNDYF